MKPKKEKKPEPPAELPPLQPSESWLSRELWWALLGCLVVSLLVFRGLIPFDQLMVTSDDNVGELVARKSQLPGAFLGGWNDLVLAGTPMYLHLNVTNLLLWLLPVRIFTNWIHAIDLSVASLGFYFFLRLRGRTPWAAAMGSLLAFWFGSTFTLNYAGHLGKFGVVLFSGPYLYLVERAVKSRKISWAILAGGAMGGMFLEQADLALFFAIPLGLYALYRASTEYKRQVLPILKLVVPLVAVAGLLAFRPIWAAQAVFVENVSVVDEENDPKAAWNYSTQWSWPPEETIDWIAPGFMGWRSGDPTGPYWGRMGQSPEWNLTKQGFRNFKLETHYLGGIPLALAAFAFFVLWAFRDRFKEEKGELVFWSGVALLTYLLALGKFFFLYKMFYALPGVSSIRNPVKFAQVTQLALGVLAAYGFDFAFTRRERLLETEEGRTKVRRFVWGVLALGGVLLIAAVYGSSTQTAVVAKMVKEGWAAMSDVIAANRIKALFHGGMVVLIAGAGLFVLLSSKVEKSGLFIRRLAWGLLGVVLIDQMAMSHRYISNVKYDAYLGDTEVTKFLKQNLHDQRVFFASQGSFYNQWLGIQFPFHGIRAFNVTQIRMPEDYGAFLKATSSNLPRMCQLAAVGKVLGPGQIWGQMQNTPGMKDAFALAYAYNVASVDGTYIQVVGATETQPGQHCIVHTQLPAPRVSVITGWDVVEDEQALVNLASPSFPLFDRLMVSPDTAEGLPPSSERGAIGELRIKRSDADHRVMQITTPKSAIVRFSEKYDPHWKVRVNGKPAKLLRCDYLFQGVWIPAGIHEVEWKYEPVRWPLIPQVTAMVGCALGGILLWVRRETDPLEVEPPAH